MNRGICEGYYLGSGGNRGLMGITNLKKKNFLTHPPSLKLGFPLTDSGAAHHVSNLSNILQSRYSLPQENRKQSTLEDISSAVAILASFAMKAKSTSFASRDRTPNAITWKTSAMSRTAETPQERNKINKRKE